MDADQKLDAEALELLRAASGESFREFPAMEGIADFWRRAAIKARELYAERPPRFVVKTAKNRPKPFWIVHDTEADLIYPFGAYKHAEKLARQCADDLANSRGYYIYDRNTKNYL